MDIHEYQAKQLLAKFGIGVLPGGGRASARETVGRVAASAVARLILAPAGV